MTNYFSDFSQILESLELELNEQQYERFEIYFEQLVEWNKVMNLTAITEREQVFLKHFYDSLLLSQSVQMNEIGSIVDIGSGAGFPSFPLKIMFPHIEVTIIDSLGKRIKFLSHLVDKLNLTNVQLLHARAEDAAREIKLRDKFDLATARAVAKLNVLNELCVPFVKTDGYFAAMKGTDPLDEVNEARYSAKQLKCEYIRTDAFQLPNDSSERNIVLYRKTAATPKQYPRKAGLPAKNPLQGSH